MEEQGTRLPFHARFWAVNHVPIRFCNTIRLFHGLVCSPTRTRSDASGTLKMEFRSNFLRNHLQIPDICFETKFLHKDLYKILKNKFFKYQQKFSAQLTGSPARKYSSAILLCYYFFVPTISNLEEVMKVIIVKK